MLVIKQVCEIYLADLKLNSWAAEKLSKMSTKIHKEQPPFQVIEFNYGQRKWCMKICLDALQNTAGILKNKTTEDTQM